MTDFILAVILFLVICAAVVYLVRAKRSGQKCIGCPSGCNGCGGNNGHCNHTGNENEK